MAINLTCYTVIEPAELQKILDVILCKYPEVFPEHYILYAAKTPDFIQNEISNENGLDPKSFFRISLNNKSLCVSTKSIADMMREELGPTNVIVLFDGETLI